MIENITPVILSGGAGRRLWPLSRPDRPKQFLRLAGDQTMLQATLARLQGIPGLGIPVVVTGRDHAHLVDLDLEDVEHRIIVEPARRNTAPAVAAAAVALSTTEDPVLLVLPSDHIIEDVAEFKAAVLVAVDLAEDAKLVTFGIVPTYAETGYGYVRAGDPVGISAFRVDAFVEKPDPATALEFVESDKYWWNSGMFAFRASQYLAELSLHKPEIVAAVESAVGDRVLDDRLYLDANTFTSCPSDSIDFAVMERTSDAVVIPLDAGWSDVGSWSAVGDVATHDDRGNVTHGDVLLSEAQDSVVWSEGRLIVAVGIEDLTIVETADAVLVADQADAQQVKELVDRLRDEERPEALGSRHEIRPWGSFEVLTAGDRYQIKRVVVNPGAKLSLQSHRHRAEEWTVVNGTAHITLDRDEITVAEGNTVSISVGSRHRLENPGHTPLVVIEVQLGSYFGEDDIVRYADDYGRS